MRMRYQAFTWWGMPEASDTIERNFQTEFTSLRWLASLFATTRSLAKPAHGDWKMYSNAQALCRLPFRIPAVIL